MPTARRPRAARSACCSRRVEDDALRRQHERGARWERRAVDADVDRVRQVSGRELLAVSDVEHDRVAGRLEPLERRRRAEERPAVQLDDPVHVRRPRRVLAERVGDEVVDGVDLQRAVEPPLEPHGRGRVGPSPRRRGNPQHGPGTRTSSRAPRVGAGCGRAPRRLRRRRPRDRAAPRRRRTTNRRSAAACRRRAARSARVGVPGCG